MLELSAANWKQIKQNLDELDDCAGEEFEGFKLIKCGEWVHNHKRQSQEVIFQDLSTNKFYRYYQYRSGSYHTDWYYDEVAFCDLEEVEQKETVVITWIEKKVKGALV